MKLLITRAMLLGICAALTAIGFSQGFISIATETADVAARDMEARLKENGLSMTKKDVERLQEFYNHVGRLSDLRKSITLKQRAAAAAGLTKESNALLAERKALDTIWKQLPSEPDKKSGNMPGFWQQLQQYHRQRQKSNATRMTKAETAMNKVQAVLDKQASGSNNESTGSVAGQWAILVSGGTFSNAAGTMRFFINGQEVTRNNQEIKIPKGRPIIVRAVGIDARRSMIRNFQETVATSLKGDPTDYGITYETKSGSFTGSTTFAMKSEEYSWNISMTGDRDADHSVSDSKLKIGLKQDLATIKWSNQLSAKITASMNIGWSSSSMRPAGRRNSEESGTAKGSITIKVLPD